MRVVVSDRVKKFLLSERKYLEQHSTIAGKRLAQRFRETASLLSSYPFAGVEKQLPMPGLRRFVVDDYLLDYEIIGDEVHILTMRHGRQRDPHLPPEDDFDFEVE